MKRVLRAGFIAGMSLALAACSNFAFNQDKVQYESSASRAPLEIPPGMDSVPVSDRYAVPSRPQSVWASQEAQREAQAGQQQVVGYANVLPEGDVAKIVREGNSRWIHTDMTPEQVWPLVQDFWNTVGLTLSRQNPKTGVMETNWAENRAKLPQDIIRGTLGKVLDMVYSTGERDQYRARLERSAKGGTDIFVTHRSMVEVVKKMGGDNETTVWQPGPSDPEMEAEMLTRMTQRINAEFNPKAVAKSPEAHKQEVKQLATYVVPEAKSEVELSEAGQVASVYVKEGFERAWRRVALAVDRMGFTVEDRDRSRGFFLVRYLDEEYEQAKRDEQGFWTNLFSKDQPVEAPQYVIYLQPLNDAATRVHVLGPDGKADPTGIAPKILTLLNEQTR
ncbi:MAG: outer membrane protein assembly factor BamC [Burkholderiaceae bacterium]|nr:outer membrane protein assembly factor BamC [Burkholderiaceae bacterium]